LPIDEWSIFCAKATGTSKKKSVLTGFIPGTISIEMIRLHVMETAFLPLARV
jgi:hypothetical protein